MSNIKEYSSDEISVSDSVISISYLVWIIAKQQWRLVLGLTICTLLIYPAPALFFSMAEEFRLSYGLIADFAFMPSLLILLVFLPVVNTQIGSSSIQKRLNASGVSSRIYTMVLIVSFAILATLLFYFMIVVAAMLFAGKVTTVYDESYIIWNPDIQWFSLLTLTPIAMVGLASTGVLISRWKAPDIAKGVATFLIVIALLSLSRTILTPYDSINMGEDSYNSDLKKAKHLDNMLLYLNPWGSMVFSAQYGMIGNILGSSFDLTHNTEYIEGVPTDVAGFETIINISNTILYSLVWTTALTWLTVYTSK